MSNSYFSAYLKRKGEKLEEELGHLERVAPSEKARITGVAERQ